MKHNLKSYHFVGNGIDKLLTPKADKLINKTPLVDPNSSFSHIIGGVAYPIPVLMASKTVNLSSNKFLDEDIERWADFVNYVIDQNLCDSAVALCSAYIKEGSLLDACKQAYNMGTPSYSKGILYFYFLPSHTIWGLLGLHPSKYMGNFIDDLNNWIKWNVFVHEDEAGTDDWSTCPFKTVAQKNTVQISGPPRSAIFISIDKIISQFKDIMPVIDKSKYPNTCPKCGAAAYLGLNQIDCSNGLCK